MYNRISVNRLLRSIKWYDGSWQNMSSCLNQFYRYLNIRVDLVTIEYTCRDYEVLRSQWEAYYNQRCTSRIGRQFELCGCGRVATSPAVCPRRRIKSPLPLLIQQYYYYYYYSGCGDGARRNVQRRRRRRLGSWHSRAWYRSFSQSTVASHGRRLSLFLFVFPIRPHLPVSEWLRTATIVIRSIPQSF